MSKRQIFIGIDLGTSNSSISYLNIQPNSLKPSTISIRQLGREGETIYEELLPSYIYFNEKGQPLVGKYSKSMYQNQAKGVFRSIKNFMGTGEIFELNNKKYTPAELSSYILKTLKKNAERWFQREIKDVIIAVPASFDMDMRADTIEAAEKAGFNVRDENGNIKNILIDEPRAALMDLINKHMNGEMSHLFTSNDSKIIMVYDLGGGTLDVSLHKMYYDYNKELPDIEDIAISRYTQIGGDNFDEMIAKWFLDEFLKQYPSVNWDELSELEQQRIMAKLRIQAENAKKQISQKEEMLFDDDDDGWGFNDEETINISPGMLLPNKMFHMEFSEQNYIEKVSKLMGVDITFNDYETLEVFTEEDKYNIIYPILDVLNKAKLKLKTLPNIDYVLVTGGMTKLKFIKDRIRDLLKIEPMVLVDPDKSVSKGAAVYAYLANKGYKQTPVLAETIYLGLKSNICTPLITAGTTLPIEFMYEQPLVVSQEGASQITLPFYRGNSENSSDNILLNKRVFDLKIPRSKGTEVSLKISMSPNKVLKIDAWLTSDPDVKIAVTVDSTKEYTVPEIKPIIQPKSQNGIQQKAETNNTQLVRENIKSLANKYRSLLRKYNTTEKELKEIEDQINRSLNYDEAIPIFYKIYREKINYIATKRLAIFISRIMQKSLNSDPNNKLVNSYRIKFERDLIDSLRMKLYDSEFIILRRVYGALVAVGNLKVTNAEYYVQKIITAEDKKYNKVRHLALTTLAKISLSEESLDIFIDIVDIPYNSKNKGYHQIAIWGVGKLAQLDSEYVFSRSKFRGIIPKLLDYFDMYFIRSTKIDSNYINNVLRTLAEIGDRRNIMIKPLDDNLQNKIISRISDFHSKVFPDNISFNEDIKNQSTIINQKLYTQKLCDVAIAMLKGIELDNQQEEILLEIRSKY